MKYILLILCLSCSTFVTKAQVNPTSEFDFWIGKWEAKMSVAPNWEVKNGIDEVTKLLDGRLIEEVFTKNFGDNANFQRGYLTYVVREKRWSHTIYDAKWGSYAFFGKKEGDKMILQSEPSDTRPGIRRETFYNIKSDSFSYLWEASYDQGKTWREEWKVEYTRIKN